MVRPRTRAAGEQRGYRIHMPVQRGGDERRLRRHVDARKGGGGRVDVGVGAVREEEVDEARVVAGGGEAEGGVGGVAGAVRGGG